MNGGGDASSTGSGLTLSGTVGQPDAGPTLGGGGYTLTGGFWGGLQNPIANWLKLFLPFVRKSP